jgi:hypothetical protein
MARTKRDGIRFVFEAKAQVSEMFDDWDVVGDRYGVFVRMV